LEGENSRADISEKTRRKNKPYNETPTHDWIIVDNTQNQTETQDTTPRIQEYARIAVVGGALAYSVYSLGRLGYSWGKEGVRALKDRKNQKTEIEN
jgi:hypothetical protein